MYLLRLLFNIINSNVYDVIIDKKMTSAHSMTNSQSSLIKSSSNCNIPMAYSTSPDITQGNLGKPSSNKIPQNNKNVTSDQITIKQEFLLIYNNLSCNHFCFYNYFNSFLNHNISCMDL